MSELALPTAAAAPPVPAPPAAEGLLRRQCACGTHSQGGAECDECQRQRLRRKASGDAPERAPDSVERVLAQPGAALDEEERAFLEPRFGADFSGVRVHTDAQAAESARAVGALAYSVGRHLVFGAGQYRPRSAAGRRLLAHELAHTLQEGAPRAAGRGIEIGAPHDPEERAADRMADAAMAGRPLMGRAPARRPATALRRAVGTGPGWKNTKGINGSKSEVGAVRRIPIDALDLGLQSDAKAASGKAIVLIPKTFDPTKSAEILVHFHGHNWGYIESNKAVMDEGTDNIEGQLEGSGRTQTIAILPQGNYDSNFGKKATAPASGPNKAFDTDAYINEVLDTLVAIKELASKPGVARVIVSGHSGAGEQINQMMLGGDPESPIPSKLGGLILIDAINGPGEFQALQAFLKKKLADELAAIKAKTKDEDRLAFLKTSFRFRSTYSHSKSIGDYYSKWNVGPIPDAEKAKLSDPRPIATVFDEFFAAAAKDLGGTSSDVYKAFRANYAVSDAGTGAHVGQVKEDDHLQKGLSAMPSLEAGAAAPPALAPASVHRALRGPGRPLEAADRIWAEGRFHRGLEGVRVHDGEDAARSAAALGAQAYTVGRDIVFGRGRYAPGSGAGRRLLAHELTHVMQQGGLRRDGGIPSELPVGRPGDAFEREAERAESEAALESAGGTELRVQRSLEEDKKRAAVCEANANPTPAAGGSCYYKEPENCPTYEGWVSSFTALKTFDSKDTPGTTPTRQKVLGGGPADLDFNKPSDPPKKPAPPVGGLKPGERFIDHPTDEWVKTCLPENLRATAYELPADCADVAIILRHVWLSAHHRTQQMGGYQLGDTGGGPAQRAIGKVISDVGTNTVADILQPYAGPDGKALRSSAALGPLLHPGDILVWWHYDKGFDKPHTGGHTHTIIDVQRDDAGQLTSLTMLQGNEPIGRFQKPEIHDFLKKEKSKDYTDKELGSAPGRRIEQATSGRSGLDLHLDKDVTEGKETLKVWQWGGNTLLHAAGPPRSAPRPLAKAAKGGKVQRSLGDWAPAFKRAAVDALPALLEGALYELRADVEGGNAPTAAEVESLAQAAGGRVWELGKAAQDLGNESHFQLLQRLLEIVQGFGSSRGAADPNASTAKAKTTNSLVNTFNAFQDAFEKAARGGADIDFAKGTKKGAAVNVLLTGFDPFDTTGSLAKPGPGEWNPSGAAVMALDGQRLPVADSKGAKATAATEGIVLPVDFKRFSTGLVEQMVGPHLKELDALLTVSLDPNLETTDPVRLEHYSVGVHGIGGKLEGVPATGGAAAGPAIIESKAPLGQIAADTEKAAKGKDPGIPKPTTGETVTLRFEKPEDADAALKALKLPPQGKAQVKISDPAALQQIISTQGRKDPSGALMQFKAGGQDFEATVVSGPGGNFLSNEVAYRAQRLSQKGGADDPISFHVHTPGNTSIPQDTSTPAARKARKQAQGEAMAQRGRLIETLKRMVGAVSKAVLDKRAAKSAGGKP